MGTTVTDRLDGSTSVADPTSDLGAIEALSGTGIAARTGASTWALRTFQVPANGFTLTNPGGVGGNPTFALANDLAALEGLASTGIAVRTASDAWAQRTITAGNGIAVTNGSGAAGNPVVAADLGLATIWVPAAAMVANTTNGPASGSVEVATNLTMLVTKDFDASTAESVQFSVQMPVSWDEGTVTAKFVWKHAATTTNFGVAWDIAATAYGDGDDPAAFGTAIVVTDTGGTTNRINVSATSGAVTISGTPQPGDWVAFRVRRAPANAADTMAIDAGLLGVSVFFTINALKDG